MAQEDSRQEGRRAERWARVNFPNKFVHPHEYTARDGRVFDKMFVSIPPGVTLNGVDLGGYAFDHFAKPREIEQKANGRPVAINFRPGEPVRLFRGVGPERRTLEISNPWDLCRAVKAHNDEYARSRQEAAAMSAEAGVAVRSADIPIHRYSRPRGMDDLQWRGLDPLGRLGASMSEERGLYGALRSGGVADSFDYAGYAYAAREDDDRQMWCSDDGYIVDADLPNMPPLSARGLEDAVAALETGAAVMDPADPTNMAVTAAESGRAL